MQSEPRADFDVGLLKESELWPIRQNPRVRMELVSRHLAFAKSIAIRYRGKAESLEDLLQVASLGLVLAVDRYDPNKGIPFVAFASPTIHGELKRHFRDRVSNIRVPRALYDRIGQMERMMKELRASLNHEPTTREIARALGCDERQIDEARVAAGTRNPIPIVSDPQEEDANEEKIGRIDDGYNATEVRMVVESAIAALNPEDRDLISLRFEEELTQNQIAERVGCSQMHVSRRLRSILESMAQASSMNRTDDHPAEA